MAAAATRRCTALESRLSEIERRATEAETRVVQLRQELERHEKQTAFSVLRRKLLILVKTFHPDRTTATTPTEVTKVLNNLVEELDGSASY